MQGWRSLLQYDCADVLVVSSEAAIPTALVTSWLAVTCSVPSTGNVSAGSSFSKVAYPNPVYSQEGAMYGAAGLLCLLFILFDAGFLVWNHSSCCGGRKGGAIVSSFASGSEPGAASRSGSEPVSVASSKNVAQSGGSLDVEASSREESADSGIGRGTAVRVQADDAVATASDSPSKTPTTSVTRPDRGCSYICAARAALYEARAHPRVLCVQAVVGVMSFVPMIAVIFAWRECTYRPSPVFGP